MTFMFKLVKSMFRSLGRQEKPKKRARPASYVPLYAPEGGEIFPDFSKVGRVVPKFALGVETLELTACYFQEHVFLFLPSKVLLCNNEGHQVGTFDCPCQAEVLHAIDAKRLLCVGAESSFVLSWQDGQTTNCVEHYQGLAGLAWLGERLLGFFVRGDREVAHELEQEDWSHRILDSKLSGELEPFTLALKDGGSLTSPRLAPLGPLAWRAPHPLGPAQPRPSDPGERDLAVVFDSEAASAPQVGQPRHHWGRYPSHQQSAQGRFEVKAREGRVLALFQQEGTSKLVYWEDPELVPELCEVCRGPVRVSSTLCPCGAKAPSTGVKALSRSLLFSPGFEGKWERYLQLRDSLPGDTRLDTPGCLEFGHLKTALKPVRSRYYQVGTFSEVGAWQPGELLEEVSHRAEIREGLCVHVNGKEFHLLTSLEEGQITTLVRGRFREDLVAAEVSVPYRRLYLGSRSGVSEYMLEDGEKMTPRRYDECITYYDTASGGKRALNGVKGMALSECGGFLLVFSGSAHSYRIGAEGLEYLGHEDLLSYYGRRDPKGRVLGHRHGKEYRWEGSREVWVPSHEAEVDGE